MSDQPKRKIVVCSGTACTDPGGKRLEPELRRILAERKAEDLVEVEEAVAYGLCKDCPMIVVEPGKIVLKVKRLVAVAACAVERRVHANNSVKHGMKNLGGISVTLSIKTSKIVSDCANYFTNYRKMNAVSSNSQFQYKMPDP